MEQKLQAMLTEWSELRAETRQYMAMLDFWIIVILVLMLFLLWASRQELYRDAIVVAAILGAAAPVWIGRIDVLIHRPVPAVRDLEHKIILIVQMHDDPESTRFFGWETHYKAEVKRGVKILVPLDVIAGLFVFALFVHANNGSWKYLETWWRGYFWWSCLTVHLFGWGIIASAKWLAE